MMLSRRAFLGGVAAAAVVATVPKLLAPPEPKLLDRIQTFDVVNVLDYGADPTGVRDSTKAFEAAMRAANFTVRVPAGKYRVNAVIDKAVHFEGEGRDRTVLTQARRAEPVMTFRKGDDHNAMARVSNMGFVGLAGLACAMLIRRKVHVDACEVRNFRDGIRIVAEGPDDQACFGVIQNTTARDNTRDGFSFGSGAVGNASIGCSAYYNGRYGFYVKPGKRTYGNSIYGAYAIA